MFKKSSGVTSTILLILGVVLIIVIIIVFVVIRINASRNTKNNPQPSNSLQATGQPQKPVYETTIGDVRFVFESAQNLGSVLVSKSSYEQNLYTTEKYIKVTIGAQNKGKLNVAAYSWEVGNIVDSDGRNFVSIDNQAYSWLPNPNLCGSLLKPEFDLVPCVKYYEVSKASTSLKIQVSAGTGDSGKKQQSLIDLTVTP